MPEKKKEDQQKQYEKPEIKEFSTVPIPPAYCGAGVGASETCSGGLAAK